VRKRILQRRRALAAPLNNAQRTGGADTAPHRDQTRLAALAMRTKNVIACGERRRREIRTQKRQREGLQGAASELCTSRRPHGSWTGCSTLRRQGGCIAGAGPIVAFGQFMRPSDAVLSRSTFRSDLRSKGLRYDFSVSHNKRVRRDFVVIICCFCTP